CRPRPFRPQTHSADLVLGSLSLPSAQLFRSGRLRHFAWRGARQSVFSDASGGGSGAHGRACNGCDGHCQPGGHFGGVPADAAGGATEPSATHRGAAHIRDAVGADLHSARESASGGFGDAAGRGLRRFQFSCGSLWHFGDRRDADDHGAALRRHALSVELEAGGRSGIGSAVCGDRCRLLRGQCGEGTGRRLGVVFFVFWRYLGGWKLAGALALAGLFAAIGAGFFAANAVKVLDGGWVSIAVACVMGVIMATWIRGSRYLFDKTRRNEVPLDFLAANLSKKKPQTVAGTAVFLTSDPQSAPTALLHSLKHYKVLHEQNVILSVVTAQQ